VGAGTDDAEHGQASFSTTSRVERLRARLEARPAHQLGAEALRSQGTPQRLSPAEEDRLRKAGYSVHFNATVTPGTEGEPEYTDEQLLGATHAGRQALAKRNGRS
jgi:hypothetical protein